MPYRSKNIVVGTIAEATSGTYLAPVAGTDYNVQFLDATMPEIDYGSQSPGVIAAGRAGLRQSFATMPKGKITLNWDARYSGTVSTDPKWGKLMLACGFQSKSQSTAKGYELNGTFNCQTLSIAVHNYDCGASAAAQLQGLAGCAGGSWKESAEAPGAVVKFSADFEGVPQTLADVIAAAPITTASFDTAAPDRFLGSAVVLGALNLKAQSYSIEGGTKVAPIQNAAATGGITSFGVTDQEITGTLKFVTESVATQGIDAAVRAGTVYATLTIPTLHFNRTLTNVIITEAAREDVEGYVYWTVKYIADTYFIYQQ